MDAENWRTVFAWSLAGFGGLLAWIWRKVDQSVNKEDLKEALQAMNEANREGRETMKILFANAESDRMQNNSRFNAIQDSLHRLHVDLLDRMSHRRGDDRE